MLKKNLFVVIVMLLISVVLLVKLSTLTRSEKIHCMATSTDKSICK